jgi:hypothetical protein
VSTHCHGINIIIIVCFLFVSFLIDRYAATKLEIMGFHRPTSSSSPFCSSGD